jgi:hypothetical protein
VISRYLVILLAAGAAVMRATQGAWVEAAGLASLTAGLVLLRLAGTRPALKPLAYLAFLVTALAIAVMLIRQTQSA